jgi:hypothetical protein
MLMDDTAKGFYIRYGLTLATVAVGLASLCKVKNNFVLSFSDLAAASAS